MNTRKSVLTIMIKLEHDVVQARQRARQIARLLGFEAQDQTRIATAVSEIARNAYRYAGSGKVEFALEFSSPQLFLIEIRDQGKGITDLSAIMDGRYVSGTGMGLGIVGAKRLVDRFSIESEAGSGTRVLLGKQLPARAMIGPRRLGEIAKELALHSPENAMEEIQLQNQELLQTLEALRARQEDLARLNHELEDTNRGVVALYAELDEKAVSLQRANEVKTHFLSNMTHEFRTPLNSILGLSRLLLDRVDGDLNEEQEKQISLIRKSAQDLSELVNDLLDLAKVEAGKLSVKVMEFEIEDLFSALRGMLKPLLAANTSINLVFASPPKLSLKTDEGKLSQILRNLVANALKFTEQGEIRVSAEGVANGRVVFRVSDTGIGIAPQDQERIFEEFTQIDSVLHRKSQGTGLGLPLSRRLAVLLGGDITVESAPGKGSTFSTTIPIVYQGPEEVPYIPESRIELDPARQPVLVIEDNRESLFIYEKFFKDSEYQLIPARTVKDARHALQCIRPVAIIADILLETENTWDFIVELKSDPRTRSVPIVVITVVDNETKARAVGADAFHTKPIERRWLLDMLSTLNRDRLPERILIIDDDEIARYLIRRLLPEDKYELIEAASGDEGLRLAKSTAPRAIILDLLMPGMNGFEFLKQLKDDPRTQAIPVIVSTSKRLQESDFELLGADAVAILSKDDPDAHAPIKAVEAALRRANFIMQSVPDHPNG